MDRKIATTWNVAVPTTANRWAVPTTATEGVRLIRMWVDSGLSKKLGGQAGVIMKLMGVSDMIDYRGNVGVLAKTNAFPLIKKTRF